MTIWEHTGANDSKWGCTRLSLAMPAGTIQDLWECDDCAALTRNPYRHNMWHVEERERRAA